jgi:hypothetical protein
MPRRRDVNRALTIPQQPSKSIAAEPELEPAAAKKAVRCHARTAFLFRDRPIWVKMASILIELRADFSACQAQALIFARRLSRLVGPACYNSYGDAP